MIRKAIIFGLAIAVLVGLIISPARAKILKKGMRSEEIEEIQEMLKQDPEIYPEGYTTGYYGPLTEGAVKRLQKRYDLPQTGIMDEETKQKVYPWWHRGIKVTSPNGGETWNRNNIQTIEWYVTKREEEPVEGGESQGGQISPGEEVPDQTPPQRDYSQITDQKCDAKNPCEKEDLECYAFPDIGLRCAKSSPCSYYRCPQDSRCILLESYPAKVRCQKESPSPPWSKASIDLFKCKVKKQIEGEEAECVRSVFVKHIGTTNLFSGSYSWNISNRVKNGDDYVIRVSTGRKIISALRKKGAARERALRAIPRKYWKVWDESDEPFTITGELPSTPGIEPDIEEAIKSLKEIQEELRKVSRQLDKVIDTLGEL